MIDVAAESGTRHELRPMIGARLHTVLESTVSSTELSEFFVLHRVLGRELSEFFSADYLCAKANSPRFSKTHRVCCRTQGVLSSETVLSKQYSARFLYDPWTP